MIGIHISVVTMALSHPTTLNLELMSTAAKKLAEESMRASEMLLGKVVARVVRHRESEVLLEFTDGTRLFVNSSGEAVELSVSGSGSE